MTVGDKAEMERDIDRESVSDSDMVFADLVSSGESDSDCVRDFESVWLSESVMGSDLDRVSGTVFDSVMEMLFESVDDDEAETEKLIVSDGDSVSVFSDFERVGGGDLVAVRPDSVMLTVEVKESLSCPVPVGVGTGVSVYVSVSSSVGVLVKLSVKDSVISEVTETDSVGSALAVPVSVSSWVSVGGGVSALEMVNVAVMSGVRVLESEMLTEMDADCSLVMEILAESVGSLDFVFVTDRDLVSDWSDAVLVTVIVSISVPDSDKERSPEIDSVSLVDSLGVIVSVSLFDSVAVFDGVCVGVGGGVTVRETVSVTENVSLIAPVTERVLVFVPVGPGVTVIVLVRVSLSLLVGDAVFVSD